MKAMLLAIDGLIRGARTSDAALSNSGAMLPARLFVPAAVVLGATYGLFMGVYALAERPLEEGAQQAVASMVKLPALFLLTLGVTFPSLYVFNALVGCRLGLLPSLRLLVSAIVVNLTVAASMGPIVGFFALSTQSYPFMVLLNVALLALGGAIGLGFLFRMLRRLAAQAAATEFDAMVARGEASDVPVAAAVQPALNAPVTMPVAMPAGPTYRDAFVSSRVGNATLIFWIWVILYGLVGAQMGWLLRPFIGHPGTPFTWFRPRVDNFFIGAGQNLLELLRGN